MLETILFYLFSLGAVGFALGVILARSPIYSLLSLIATMCSIAGLFVLLKAFLIAGVLVLVYAGAILVLFLFVIMLVDFNKMSDSWLKFRFSPLLALLFGGIIFWQIFRVISSIGKTPLNAAHGTTQAIGRLLFKDYVLPFELTSFLLLAAVTGVVVLAKREAK